MGNHFQIPEILALRPLFQGLGLPVFLPGTDGLEEESRFADHILSLSAVGLLIVVEELDHLPRGYRRFGKTL